MEDCMAKKELEQNLIMLFERHEIRASNVEAELTLLLSGYDISKQENALTEYTGGDTVYYRDRWLLDKKIGGCTDNTIKTYRTTYDGFFREVKKSPIQVTADDVRKFLAIKELRDGSSKSYLNDIRRPLSSFYTWMQDNELITKNPMRAVPRIKEPKVMRQAFSAEDIEKIRRAAQESKCTTMIVELLLSTGCRVGEIVKIRRDEIPEDLSRLLVHGKGQKDRYVYLNAKSKFALMDYLQIRSDSNPYLLPKGLWKSGGSHNKDWMSDPDRVDPREHTGTSTIGGRIRKLGKKAGVRDCHPHRFRRTCATMALRRGMPLEQVSKMLGHESIATTQIYLDLSETELERSHDKYF